MSATATAAEIPSTRRHDLDALRALAMLLGIGFHGALSFSGQPWMVMDAEKSSWLHWFVSGVHGFRMQLFFLISGYFTALILYRRGYWGLLGNRVLRITIPCLLGYLTIIPLNNTVVEWAMAHNARHPSSPLLAAIVQSNPEKVQKLLEQGADPHEPDRRAQLPPLFWAGLVGNQAILGTLLDHGALPNDGGKEGLTALHAAAFAGHAELLKWMAQNGWEWNKADRRGITPLMATFADEKATRMIFRLGTGSEIIDWDQVSRGREAIRAFLGGKLVSQGWKNLFQKKQNTPEGNATQETESKKAPAWLVSYYRWMSDPAFKIRWGSWEWDLFDGTSLGHLWFLWFLTWMVPLYAAIAWLGSRVACWVSFPKMPIWGLLLVAMALTLPTQWCMGYVPITGKMDGLFGPDTSLGFIPRPHVFLYYLVFFLVGTVLWNRDADLAWLVWWWPLFLLLALVLVLPRGMETLGQPNSNAPFQALYTWLMILGMMGLFGALVSHPRPGIRYVSDSSYWLYLAHLPLVIALQAWVCDWRWDALTKWLGLLLVSTSLLLLSYQVGIRHTWLGWLLNGTMHRRCKDSLDNALVTAKRGATTVEPIQPWQGSPSREPA